MATLIETTPEQWLPKGESVVTEGLRIPLVLWGGIVGETAQFKIVHKGRNQTQAHFVETDTPSPHRMQIPCERYTPCGGCPMLHVDPDGQHSAHVERVLTGLREEGISDLPVEGWVRSPRMFDFRHVVKLGWGWSSDGNRIKIGAFGRRDRRIVPISKCNVAAPVLRRVMTSLAHYSLELGLEPYDPLTDEGVMRAVILRASSTTGEVMITLVTGRRPRKLNELAELVAQANGEVVGIWVHMNTEPGNALLSPGEDDTIGVKALEGRDWIEEDLDGIKVRIGPTDFYQTNPKMALPLFRRVLELLNPGPDEAFVDLYCGVGGLTLLGARRCGFAVGIEVNPGAIQRARESARRNRLSAEFISGKVEEELPLLAKRLKHPVVAVDPSRKGLHPEVLAALIEMKPRRLAYISCNPRSLARDLAVFREAGATIEPIELFDMFPHTAHVECLTILSFDVAASRSPRRKLVR